MKSNRVVITDVIVPTSYLDNDKRVFTKKIKRTVARMSAQLR